MTRSNSTAATFLRRVLLGNVVFSSISALAFLLATESIASLTGTSMAEIQQTGISLVIFVALLTLVASRPTLQAPWPLRGAILIAALDVVWVLTEPLKMSSYTDAGRLLFGVIALIVLGFAIAQISALKSLMRVRGVRRRAVDTSPTA